MDILRYGDWDGPDRFVFTPPLVRQGLVLEDVDFTDVDVPEGLTREQLIEAYIRDRIVFTPREMPTADFFAVAEQLGGEITSTYTGKHELPGGHVVQCVVCQKTAQRPGPRPPDEIAICSQPCLDELKAHPAKYLGEEEPGSVLDELPEWQAKLAMGMPVDIAGLPEEQQRIYAEVADEVGMTYYPDSVVMQCTDCGLDIFIGPRTKAAMDADAEILPMCPLCITLNAGEIGMINMGNPSGIPRSH